jgi:hypothetical protein
MSGLVDEKFREWTTGLDGKDCMISIFRHIRDIPYSLVVPMNDQKTGQEQILAIGKGCCGPKHYLLADMFQKLGIEVVYAIFPFLWNDPDLHYPPRLRHLAAGLPVAYHLACRVRINDRWVLVDATWDQPLNQAGFPVNEYWDGCTDTRCAVKPLRPTRRPAFCRPVPNIPYVPAAKEALTSHDREHNLQDCGDDTRRYSEGAEKRTPDDPERVRRFHCEFDRWLVKMRAQYRSSSVG